MRKNILISCARKKRSYKCKARDLYISDLFQKSLQYALNLAPDRIFVLSAQVWDKILLSTLLAGKDSLHPRHHPADATLTA